MSSTGMVRSSSAKRSARVRADVMLLLVAAIWGSAFVVQRMAAASLGVHLFNGARFLLAALALAPLAWLGLPGRPAESHHPEDPGLRPLAGVVIAGLLLVGGAGLQQAGLQYTTAGNAGFITGLYVVLIPLFLALFTSHRPRQVIWAAALMAVLGLFLLSTGGDLQAINRGDVLELMGAVFWALHVIVTGRMVLRMNVLRYAVGQYLVCGLVSLSIGLALEQQFLPAMLQDWWLVAYAGLLSVGMGYTLQALAQREAPPADAAILLSMEAVFAALSGWIFLGESLAPVQILGCIVMLAGMLLAQVDSLRPLPDSGKV